MAATITELAELREKLGQAGMTEVPDLKAELDAVSSQVSEVLASASEAAEGMRSRASEDAARWRAEADKEARGAPDFGHEGRRTGPKIGVGDGHVAARPGGRRGETGP